MEGHVALCKIAGWFELPFANPICRFVASYSRSLCLGMIT